MTDGHHPECDRVREHYNRKTGELLCACGADWGFCRYCGDETAQDDDPSPDLCHMCAKAGRGETVGELADRLPPNEWVSLPEHGIRVKKWGPE